MSRTYSALPHLNGHLMVALDMECTGLDPGYHEPVQIAIVPLNSDFRPLAGVTPFYTDMKPLYPERCDHRASGVHGLNIEQLLLHAPHPDKVADMLIEWFEKLDLPFEKSLIPLAHNWAFESSFLKAWLGVSLTEKLFHGHARDGMLLALSLNDRSAFAGAKAAFNSVSLKSLCNTFNIVNMKPHDALSDALAEAEVYRCLLLLDLFG